MARWSIILAGALTVLSVEVAGCGGDSNVAGDSGPDAGPDTEETSPRIAVEIACGGAMCARTEDGAVYCWGGGSAGETGPASSLVEEIGKNKVMDHGVVSLAAGGRNVCVILEDASLWCWGDNWVRQLAAPVGDYSEDPVEIDLGGPVADVVIGHGLCARMVDGGVFCWGDNSNGWVGNGADLSECVEWDDCIEPPAPVVGLDGLTVAALEGSYVPCAITGEGEAYCWGGSLPGPADAEDGLVHSSVPVFVDTFPAPVLQVDGIAALIAGNVVMRWGSNSSGELGVPTAFLDWSNVPVAIENLEGTPVRIGDGGDHACAAMEDGRVQCWGENYHGELGRGYTGDPSAIPHDVVGLSGPATDVCVGGRSVCALIDDGSIMCWGSNHSGVLGHDPDYDISQCVEWDDCLFPTPVRVIGFGPEE